MNLNVKTKKAIFLISLFLFSTNSFIFAQGLVHCGNEGQDPCTLNDLFIMIGNVINFLLTTILIPLAVLFITLAGITMLTSAGNPNKFEQGKRMITYAAVGVLVALLAWGIIKTIITVLQGETWTLFWFDT
jgi:hypothetical protein